MDKLKRIKILWMDSKENEVYHADSVDALIAEMQAEIENEKQNYNAMSETCVKKIEENERLKTQNVALMEVLEAVENNKIGMSEWVDGIYKARIKARETINAK